MGWLQWGWTQYAVCWLPAEHSTTALGGNAMEQEPRVLCVAAAPGVRCFSSFPSVLTAASLCTGMKDQAHPQH